MNYFSEKDSADICHRIRLLTAARGMSRAALARESGISYRLIHDIMHETANLRDSTIGKIAKALGVSTEHLLTGETEAANVVKEGPLVYQTREEERADARERIPETVEQSIRVLARQFGIDGDDLYTEVLHVVGRLKKRNTQ